MATKNSSNNINADELRQSSGPSNQDESDSSKNVVKPQTNVTPPEILAEVPDHSQISTNSNTDLKKRFLSMQNDRHVHFNENLNTVFNFVNSNNERSNNLLSSSMPNLSDRQKRDKISKMATMHHLYSNANPIVSVDTLNSMNNIHSSSGTGSSGGSSRIPVRTRSVREARRNRANRIRERRSSNPNSMSQIQNQNLTPRHPNNNDNNHNQNKVIFSSKKESTKANLSFTSLNSKLLTDSMSENSLSSASRPRINNNNFSSNCSSLSSALLNSSSGSADTLSNTNLQSSQNLNLDRFSASSSSQSNNNNKNKNDNTLTIINQVNNSTSSSQNSNPFQARLESENTLSSSELDVVDNVIQNNNNNQNNNMTETYTDNKQSSIVTIFTIWNAMMGTSILSMPWGIQQAGPLPSVGIMLMMLGICFYSAYLILKSPEKLKKKIEEGSTISNNNKKVVIEEFSDICYYLIGPYGQYLAVISAIIAFFGALLVYWILMSGFLYSSGQVAWDLLHGNFSNYVPFDENVICDTAQNNSLLILEPRYLQSSVNSITKLIMFSSSSTTTRTFWNTETVPIFLAVLLFPTLFIDDVVFFAKFNVLGTISVCYIFIMSISKIILWGGINITEDQLLFYNINGCFKFSGMLALGLLIHNAIITIFKNNRHQENNTRDLLIAFCLTAGTYLLVGMLFFLAFPIAKTCIADNILNNLERFDGMTSLARFFLLIQMATVFPLLAYLFRSTCYSFLYENQTEDQDERLESDHEEDDHQSDENHDNGNDESPLLSSSNSNSPTTRKLTLPSKNIFNLLLNSTTLLSCIFVTIFFPKIGKLISLVGSICGGIYIFILPSLMSFREANTTKKCYFVMVMVFGVVNVVFQFFG